MGPDADVYFFCITRETSPVLAIHIPDRFTYLFVTQPGTGLLRVQLIHAVHKCVIHDILLIYIYIDASIRSTVHPLTYTEWTMRVLCEGIIGSGVPRLVYNKTCHGQFTSHMRPMLCHIHTLPGAYMDNVELGKAEWGKLKERLLILSHSSIANIIINEEGQGCQSYFLHPQPTSNP